MIQRPGIETAGDLNKAVKRMNVQSRITAVTVYGDRGEITRSARIDLSQGEHILVFDMLPESIESESIQVRGTGNAVLGNVKLKRVYFDRHPEEGMLALEREMASVEEKIAALDDRIANAEMEKKFIDDIAKGLTAATNKSAPAELDPEKWIAMVEFYRRRHDSLDSEIREAGAGKTALESALMKIEREIASAGSTGRMSRNQVEVTVSADNAGEIALELVYVVLGPTWSPHYDLRVSTEEKSMSITYHGLVSQNTGEEWEGVTLKLSTAKPGIRGRQPELSPWRVDFYRQEFFPELANETAESAALRPAATQMFEPAEEEYGISDEETPVDMPAPPSEVSDGAVSVVFSIGGTVTVKSDNEQHRVTVLAKSFPAYFRYSSAPRLSQYAYLKAKVKNESEYPFLPGKTNVFLDGNYTATAEMETVAPGEEFWTFLGVDEGIKIGFRFINRYESKEGVFGKTAKVIYEYRITAKNNKKSPLDLVVWDQFPVSGNQEIKVALMEPEYKKDTETMKIDEHNFIEWIHRPKPGEEIKTTLKFSVEYPRGARLSGLW